MWEWASLNKEELMGWKYSSVVETLLSMCEELLALRSHLASLTQAVFREHGRPQGLPLFPAVFLFTKISGLEGWLSG